MLREVRPDMRIRQLLKHKRFGEAAIEAAIKSLSSLEPETRVYFVYSGAYGKLLKKHNAKIMVSYGTVLNSDIGKLLKGFSHVILDSGAFQEYRGVGEAINIDSYANWLLRDVLPKYSHIIDGYVNLDVIGGSGKQTLQNQKTLESYHLTPIPVWHQGEDVRVLDYYCRNYPLVGIGGLVRSKTKQLWELFNWLYQRYEQHKFHIFGAGLSMVNYEGDFKAYSCDCSTWNTPGRFGHLIKQL